jgi:hypothetical protein
MTRIRTYIWILFLSFVSFSCTQTNNNRTTFERINAENQLNNAFGNQNQHNLIDNKRIIIKDSLTAINVAEPILFGIYGKDNIINQKPYEIHLIDNCWILSGTLPKNMVGGTFLIIIDARNSKIIKITHGK